MLDAVFQVVHDETLQLINKATFIGVMVDETTDISNIGQMAIHLHCVCDGAIVNRFAGLCEVAERDALSIQRAMEDKFRALHINWKKCHLSSDGASVFTGRLNGVMVRLMRDNHMCQSLAVHCICHREALAAADAVKAVPYLANKVKPTIGGIYRLFDNSGVKEAHLHAMQHELNLPVLKLKEPKDVCWLSYDGAISAFRKTFPAVLLELERQAITDADAKAWGKRIKCYEFVASLHMLSDAVPILAKASKKFQSATVNFALVEVVLANKLLYTRIRPAYECKNSQCYRVLARLSR